MTVSSVLWRTRSVPLLLSTATSTLPHPACIHSLTTTAQLQDLLKLAGVEWKKITESEKKKWEALALKKKEEYLKAKAAYAASGGAGDADDDE